MDIKFLWDGWSLNTTATRTEYEILSQLTNQEISWVADVMSDNILDLSSAIALVIAFKETRDDPPAVAQSSTSEAIASTDTSMEQEENVMFADAEEQIDLQVGMMTTDSTYDQGLQENGSLSKFLSRPVEIYRKTWEVGAVTAFADEINPWELFLDDDRVKNKLETFKLLHGTLKLKFLINGSPYHYGRVFVGVRPTRYDNNMSIAGIDSSLTTTNYYAGNPGTLQNAFFGRTFYSQRPHIFIDPATNQPNHIDWPFFAATNYLDLNDSQTIDRLGRLEIWELNTLQHNNGATDPLTITAFAWMEDVTLTGLTSMAPAIAQSAVSTKPRKKGKSKKLMTESKNKDEYQNDGMISGPATAVMNYANYFTEIPVIGKFARATHIASGAVADVARLFGFSRPPIITDPSIFRPQTTSGMANYSGGDTLQKLTLDPKQELTIDPSSVGLPGDDQMSFGYIVKKEALIDVFTWDSQDVTERRIYSIAVHPMTRPIHELSEDVFMYSQTPLSFVTTPFQYWRGSLRYRFQIVASAFHRGRLAVVYEPSAVPSPDLDLNNRYIAILDLAQAKDFTIEVKWSQAQAYCAVRLSETEPLVVKEFPAIFSPVPAMNGCLQVYVMNELASSITTSSVDVNVYISAGDDYQLQMPQSGYQELAYARDDQTVGPPAFAQSEVITTQENDPNQDTLTVINGSYCPCNPQSNLVYFGEQIVSIRSYMKRYNYHRVLTNTGLTADQIYSQSFNVFNFPVGPGPTYGSSVASPFTAIASGNYNIVGTTHLRYFSQAYIGWRGGIRYKAVFLKGQGDSGLIKAIRQSDRLVEEGFQFTIVKGTGVTEVNTAKRYLATNLSRNAAVMEGFAFNSTLVNPTLEYEVPMYHPFRYVEVSEPVITDTIFLQKYQGNYNGGSHSIAVISRNVDTDSFATIEMYVSIGEDFSLFFFIGAPPIYTRDVLDVS